MTRFGTTSSTFTVVLFSLIFYLSVPYSVFCQTEKLGIVTYTSPPDWTKTVKENTIVFSNVDQSKGGFCFITLYGATPSTGNPKTDFAKEWNDLVVKPFKGEANPKTETESADGWTTTAGGGPVEFGGGKALALLTVYSGFGKTVSVLGILNDESYLPQLTAFVAGLDIEKAPIAAAPTALQYDTDGHLIIPPPTRQLTLADLVGEWGQNDGINTRYVYRDSGVYAGADSLHFTDKMTLTLQGGYHSDFFAIQNGKKIKEDTSGTYAVNGSVLTITQGNVRHYVIRGWLELPEMTIFVVCGPLEVSQIQEHLDNPDKGRNLDKKWVRKK